MAQNKLSKLSRKELVEIIYELQRKNEEQASTIARLKKMLSNRVAILENAGSIAEAVVSLNDLFAVAQRTADDYVASVRRAAESFDSLVMPDDIVQKDEAK